MTFYASTGPLAAVHRATVHSLVEQAKTYIDPWTRDYKSSPPERKDNRFSVVPHTYVSGGDLEEWPGKVARFAQKWEQRPESVRTAILALAFGNDKEKP